MEAETERPIEVIVDGLKKRVRSLMDRCEEEGRTETEPADCPYLALGQALLGLQKASWRLEKQARGVR